MKDNGWCVWITGLPGSGKSAVSSKLVELLEEEYIQVQLLSSDALRKIVTPEPTYSLVERDAVYTTLVYIARLLTENGVNVIIDATGNLRRYRDDARMTIKRFMEVYLTCPLDVCIEREKNRKETFHAPREIYRKAQSGEAPTVPGIGEPYQPSPKAELVIDTIHMKPEQAARDIMLAIKNRFTF